MRRSPILTLLMLILASVLAGCASPAPESDPVANEDSDDGGMGAGDDGTGAGSEGGSDAGGSDMPVGGSGAGWTSAYDYDRVVKPAEGDAGVVDSFDYRYSSLASGDTKVWEVQVSVKPVEVMEIRTDKLHGAAGNYETQVLSENVSVRPFVHKVTVVQDDSGDFEAGYAYTVTYYKAADAKLAPAGFTHLFLKATFDDGTQQASIERFATQQMKDEAAAEGAQLLHHAEGELPRKYGDWFIQPETLAVHGSGMWATYAKDIDFEPAESDMYGSKTKRVKVTEAVGDLQFTAWNHTTTTEVGESMSTTTLVLAPELPMPVSFRLESGTKTAPSSFDAFELKALNLRAA